MAAFPDPADGAPEARFAAASSYASLRDDDDEGMGDDDADSLLFRDEPDVWKSVTSSVRQHSHYNGRWYHRYREGKYPIPNDTIEQEREHMKHDMILLLTRDRLFHAPIPEHPQKILDLGTGIGIWAIEVADRFPGAEVVAVDLSPIQPSMIPSNLTLLVDDVADEWISPITDNFDFIHARCFMPLIADAPAVLQRAFDHLKPGGWFEAQDFNANVACDDGTMPPDFPLLQFWTHMQTAMQKQGCDVQMAPGIGRLMQQAGFVNVQGCAYKIPVGPWNPDSEVLRFVGTQMRQVTEDLLGAAAVKPFASLGMDEAEVEDFMEGVREALHDPDVHAYAVFYSWFGQKPA